MKQQKSLNTLTQFMMNLAARAERFSDGMRQDEIVPILTAEQRSEAARRTAIERWRRKLANK